MSLLKTAERLASIDRSEVVLRSQQCLRSYDQFSICEACFEICPAGAIQLGKSPVLDANKCQACLACLPVCPVGATSADDPVKSLLNCIARLDTKTVDLVCALHGTADTGPSSESTGIRVPGCLAGLGTGTYLALVALGLERLVLRLDACGSCPWETLRNRIQAQVYRACQFLARWEKSESLICVLKLEEQAERPLWDANNPPLSRRDLFRLAAHQGQVAMARAMNHDHAGINRHLGRDRLRLNNALAHLSDPKTLLDSPIEAGNFAMLSISEVCHACSVCARVCPTDALKFKVNDEKTYYWLNFDPQACIGCEACIHVCAPEAIEIDNAPAFKQVFGNTEPYVLREGELGKCEQCKATFAADPGQNLCPVCICRRKNPFGSMMPPGVKVIGKPFGGQKYYDS